MPTLWGYLAGEIKPGPTTAVADPIWGATERDVMYNSLIYVPYQLERLMWFGMAVCMDPFLSVFTTIPLRALKAVGDLLRGIVAKAGIHGRSTGACPFDHLEGVASGRCCWRTGWMESAKGWGGGGALCQDRSVPRAVEHERSPQNQRAGWTSVQAGERASEHSAPGNSTCRGRGLSLGFPAGAQRPQRSA